MRVHATLALVLLAATFDTPNVRALDNVSVVSKSVAPHLHPSSPYQDADEADGQGQSAPSEAVAHRAVVIDVPLKVNGAYAGDVTVQIARGGIVSAASTSLRNALAKAMKQAEVLFFTAPGGNGGDADGGITEISKQVGVDDKPLFISRLFSAAGKQTPAAPDIEPVRETTTEKGEAFLDLALLKKRGLEIRYDPQASELLVAAKLDGLRDNDVSLSTAVASVTSANVQKPAFFSAYVNMRMAAAYVDASRYGTGGARPPNFDFEGAARIGSVVFEAEATLAGNASSDLRGGGEAYGLTRRGTRLVYDWPEEVLRAKAGDLTPAFTGFQSSSALLGVSVERSYAQLRPGQSIQPTGQRSFKLERPSNVDILIDGAILRRLRLQPGNYNLSDLPISPGATKITLAIEDDTGVRQVLNFNTFSGASLLSPGLDEWQFAAGVRSHSAVQSDSRARLGPVGFDGPAYAFDDPAMSAFYRLGLTPAVTAGFNLQADTRSSRAGVSAAAQTPYGFVTADLAGNYDASAGPGFAARASYEIANMKRDNGLSHSLHLGTEFTSAAFTGAGSENRRLTATPTLGFTAAYARELTDTVNASIAASVSAGQQSLYEFDRWDVDLTFTTRFSDALSAAFTFGYGEGGTKPDRDIACVCYGWLEARGARALARFSYHPDAASTVSLDHDAAAKTTRLSASTSSGSGIGSWTASVDGGFSANDRASDANAALSLAGNRGDVSLSHSARAVALPSGRFDFKNFDDRTTIRAETSIATADGVWSFGQPVRNSFAIVDPHETLAGLEVTAGTKDAAVAKSDILGRAMVSNIEPYVQRRVGYEVDNLPDGYDLGAGAFDFNGPYKAGYRVKAGSAYTITAIGTLVDKLGQPVSLLQGTAIEEGKTKGAEVEIFTNKTGRFGAQGLAPGTWRIELGTEPDLKRYRIVIPGGVVGLYQAGTLTPQQ